MKRKQEKPSTPANRSERFESQANEKPLGIVAEFWHFFLTNKKWWMIPIVLVLLLMTGLVMLGGTALAPAIYALF